MANDKKKQINIHVHPQVRHIIALAATWVSKRDPQFCASAAYKEAEKVLRNFGIWGEARETYVKGSGKKWLEEEELFGPASPQPEPSAEEETPKEEYAEEIKI